MVDLLKPDLCVIGAGPGGSTAAAAAVALGAKVVVVAANDLTSPEGWIATRFLLAAARDHRVSVSRIRLIGRRFRHASPRDAPKRIHRSPSRG